MARRPDDGSLRSARCAEACAFGMRDPITIYSSALFLPYLIFYYCAVIIALELSYVNLLLCCTVYAISSP